MVILLNTLNTKSEVKTMRHLIPFTKDQISIIETSLEASLKYADSEYIEEVDAILKEIKNNTRF